MSIFGFFKNHIPSFEDEFVQSDEELALEKAPKSSQQCHCTINHPESTLVEVKCDIVKTFPYGPDFGVNGCDPRPL
jgi:hypothetical protein